MKELNNNLNIMLSILFKRHPNKKSHKRIKINY
jgi:hypothetical protein